MLMGRARQPISTWTRTVVLSMVQSARKMTEFKEWQLQFQQIYDGAYRYYDRCGEFMSEIRAEFGFMPLSVTPNTCDMDAPDEGLRIQCNPDVLTVTSSDPARVEAFLRVSDYASTRASEMFAPFRVHQNRMAVSSIRKTATQEESFQMSLKPMPSAVADIARALEMVVLNQSFAYTFFSGSRALSMNLQPVVVNVTAAQRNLAQFGSAKSVVEHLAKREQLAKQVQPPSYGLGFDVTVVENEPPVTANSSEMLNFLRKERKKILLLIKSEEKSSAQK